MREALASILAAVVLSGCGQNPDKVSALAKRYCACHGSVVESISFYTSFAMVTCQNRYFSTVKDDDFIADCGSRPKAEEM